jgi:hypothetical protein
MYFGAFEVITLGSGGPVYIKVKVSQTRQDPSTLEIQDTVKTSTLGTERSGRVPKERTNFSSFCRNKIIETLLIGAEQGTVGF